MATSLDKFRVYREEDKHECNLLSARINALLTSQSLFMAAAAVLYSATTMKPKEQKYVLLLLAAISLAMAILTGIAIWIGCRVLRQWHVQGSNLLQNEKYQDELEGCYLKGRKQPDWSHKISIEIFGVSLPFIFALFWLFVILGLLFK